jgi:hypothetical protein
VNFFNLSSPFPSLLSLLIFSSLFSLRFFLRYSVRLRRNKLSTLVSITARQYTSVDRYHFY